MSYYRFPAITNRYGEWYEWEEYKLKKKRRDGFLATIQRKNVSEDMIDNFRIYLIHFISCKPTGMCEVMNVTNTSSWSL